ncbi:MAG: hypothetical protein AAGG02_18030 [Cyanobacteria bacterium P01_H01_bin.15]
MADELRSVLELATEDELQNLTEILFCRRFNPLDYLQTPAPLEVASQNLDQWLDSLEDRFRYLAADGLSVLTGSAQSIGYRDVLVKVCQYLKIPYAQEMTTLDVESEIFLHLMGKAWQRLPDREKRNLAGKIQKSLATHTPPQALPVGWQHNPVNLLLKGGGAIAVSSLLKPVLLRQIAQQFALHFARYQTAKSALIRGGAIAASKVQNQIILKTAQRGMAATAAQYGTVRAALSFLGPMLWGWLIADLGWRSIATNYTRIIPVVFTLAQIRLTRSECWELA